MNLADFKESLNTNNPPAEASVYLKALWHDAKKIGRLHTN
jgi:hypothetical protein